MQWGYGTMSGYGKIKKETEKQNKEGNPLLLQEAHAMQKQHSRHFAPQNKED